LQEIFKNSFCNILPIKHYKEEEYHQRYSFIDLNRPFNFVNLLKNFNFNFPFLLILNEPKGVSIKNIYLYSCSSYENLHLYKDFIYLSLASIANFLIFHDSLGWQRDPFKASKMGIEYFSNIRLPLIFTSSSLSGFSSWLIFNYIKVIFKQVLGNLS